MTPKDKLKINFLAQNESRLKRKLVFIFPIFLIFSFAVSVSVSAIFNNSQTNPLAQEKKPILVSTLSRLLTSAPKIVKGEDDDRINFLLLGMGGVGHEGPYLTDTIILASFQSKQKKAAMVSFPRDLVIPVNGSRWPKINYLNAYGEAKALGNGPAYTAHILEKALDAPIHYWLRLDFDAFIKIIDELGGIDIYVERSFIDEKYPAPNFEYQTVQFEKGWQHLDGDQALKFARSRHGTNGEGSDFARAGRQQKIIEAVKDKVFSFSFFLRPDKIKKIFDLVKNNLSTNISIGEALSLAQKVKDIEKEDIAYLVIKDGPDGQVVPEMTEFGEFILHPPGYNYDAIKNLIKDIFGKPSVEAGKKEAEPDIEKIAEVKDKIKVIIWNGTFIAGLAASAKTKLETDRYEVVSVGNAPRQNYEKTTIYALGSQEVPASLKEKFNPVISASLPPLMREKPGSTNADFLIVLGTDAE